MCIATQLLAMAEFEGSAKGKGLPRLLVKIYYPSVCNVEEGDLDNILDWLVQNISGFTITLQAYCKNSSTKTLMRSVADYLTGGPVSLAPYCKTGDQKTPCILIEMMTTEGEKKTVLGLKSKVQEEVERYVKVAPNTPASQKPQTQSPIVVSFSD